MATGRFKHPTWKTKQCIFTFTPDKPISVSNITVLLLALQNGNWKRRILDIIRKVSWMRLWFITISISEGVSFSCPILPISHPDIYSFQSVSIEDCVLVELMISISSIFPCHWVSTSLSSPAKSSPNPLEGLVILDYSVSTSWLLLLLSLLLGLELPNGALCSTSPPGLKLSYLWKPT